jgi:hypothetical protein
VKTAQLSDGRAGWSPARRRRNNEPGSIRQATVIGKLLIWRPNGAPATRPERSCVHTLARSESNHLAVVEFDPGPDRTALRQLETRPAPCPRVPPQRRSAVVLLRPPTAASRRAEPGSTARGSGHGRSPASRQYHPRSKPRENPPPHQISMRGCPAFFSPPWPEAAPLWPRSFHHELLRRKPILAIQFRQIASGKSPARSPLSSSLAASSGSGCVQWHQNNAEISQHRSRPASRYANLHWSVPYRPRSANLGLPPLGSRAADVSHAANASI